MVPDANGTPVPTRSTIEVLRDAFAVRKRRREERQATEAAEQAVDDERLAILEENAQYQAQFARDEGVVPSVESGGRHVRNHTVDEEESQHLSRSVQDQRQPSVSQTVQPSPSPVPQPLFPRQSVKGEQTLPPSTPPPRQRRIKAPRPPPPGMAPARRPEKLGPRSGSTAAAKFDRKNYGNGYQKRKERDRYAKENPDDLEAQADVDNMWRKQRERRQKALERYNAMDESRKKQRQEDEDREGGGSGVAV